MQVVNLRKTIYLLVSFTVCIASCRTSISPEDYRSTLACRWNQEIFNAAIEEDGLLTLKGLRTASMTHIAMHNALNAIVRKYESYNDLKLPASDASPTAAVTQAAFVVVSDQYPSQMSKWTAMRDESLASVKDEHLRRNGIELGTHAANQILAERRDDNFNSEATYVWQPMAPGVYAEFNKHSGTPEGFVFGAGWARAVPFILESPDQFRSPPPPNINSKDYTAAFNEVKEVGSTKSQLRTSDQAHLAMWWKDFIENSHNRFLRKYAVEEQLDLWEASRSFAMLNMAIYDAYICVFDNKFHYNHWRPYTAIRWAEHDGNDETIADTNWNNLHMHTYAFPSYPSAHGTGAAAAMTVLAKTLGKGNAYAFTMRTDSVDEAGPFSKKVSMTPPTRSFESFMDAAMEASISRVYLGIHFRYDSEEGFNLGRQIGEYVCNYLKPVNELNSDDR